LKLTKDRTLRFNMGKYEHVEITGRVEVDTDEMDFTHQGAVAYANKMLDQLLAEDVERAAIATQTPEDDTFVDKWKELTDDTNR
jgi:hypothetical protein